MQELSAAKTKHVEGDNGASGDSLKRLASVKKAVATSKNPQHDATAKTGAIWNPWNVVQTTVGGSTTTPTRQHPELGQAHRARMHYHSMQRATANQHIENLAT